MPNDDIDSKAKLLQLLRETVKQDNELREKFQIGTKFRFIHDRLQNLMAHVEESLSMLEKQEEEEKEAIAADESLVYVYLYNAQGLVLKTWQKFLNPAVFYEYSVNRPIYSEKSHIETFIRYKKNPAQHGYLTVVVKKVDILPSQEPMKDALSNPIIKVKEGSLLASNLLAFTHNGQDYLLDAEGELFIQKKIDK